MSEFVTRHRGGGFDDNQDPLPASNKRLSAIAVAPGATAEYVDRGRNGERVEFTVYFWPAVDLVGSDELTVRGDRYRIRVEQWQSPKRPRRRGTVALCSRGEG